jgi:hypothetical protein
MHGSDRHSYLMTKNDMAFCAIEFLTNLTQAELETFCKLFNKVTPEQGAKLHLL